MTPREELESLRRLAELEAKARGESVVPSSAPEAKSTAESEAAAAMADRRALSGVVPGAHYLIDAWMGARSVPDAGAQLLTRGLESVAPAGSSFEQWARGQRENVEAVNAKAQEEYRKKFKPDLVPGTSVAQGVGAGLAAAPMMAAFGPAATLGGRVLQGAGFGATQGALTPVEMNQTKLSDLITGNVAPQTDFWSEKRKQIGIGGTVGAAIPLAFAGGSRILSPQTNPAAAALMREGVTPTPGQVLGGIWKTSEEKATSLPLFGEAIKAGQRRSIEDFNRAVYARALQPLGEEAVQVARTAPVGNEGIRRVGDTLSNAYNQALAQSVPSSITPNFQRAINQVHGMVPQSQRNEFLEIINREINAKLTPRGTITPSVAKEAESELGRLASNYRGSAIGAERELGRALGQGQAELRQLVAQNNPTIAPRIQAINNGWAQLVQIENAGAMLGAKDGIFTPAQYLNAVKKSDRSLRDRAFARGQARNQSFAQSADAALSSRYPDSGTFGRAAFGTLLGAGAYGVHPAIPMAAGTAALAYTSPGQRAMSALLSSRPQVARDVASTLDELAPYLTAPLVASGLL